MTRDDEIDVQGQLMALNSSVAMVLALANHASRRPPAMLEGLKEALVEDMVATVETADTGDRETAEGLSVTYQETVKKIFEAAQTIQQRLENS